MNNSLFSPVTFFDLSNFSHAALFEGISNVWEVLPKLTEYIESLFVSKKILANYGKDTAIFVGQETIIEETAVINGPAIIGKNCYIGHAAFLRGPILFGDNIHIGHAVEVKSSILLNNATAAHLNYVGDSVIGNVVNIGGGTMFANLRLDKKIVTIRTEKEKIDTGLQKFSAIVGDFSSIGVNAVINPGTILGKHTVVYPLTSVFGVHQEKEIIK